MYWTCLVAAQELCSERLAAGSVSCWSKTNTLRSLHRPEEGCHGVQDLHHVCASGRQQQPYLANTECSRRLDLSASNWIVAVPWCKPGGGEQGAHLRIESCAASSRGTVCVNKPLHLNCGSVSPEVGTDTTLSHASFFPSSSSFFSSRVSSRQLVSNIYLLPFQLDKDNREAWPHSGLRHFKATVAAAEVMAWKRNGPLLFPLEHSETQLITLGDLSKEPRSRRIQGSPGDHLQLLLAPDVGRWRDERLWEKRHRGTVSVFPFLSLVRTRALWERRPLLLSMWCFVSIQCHTQM